jgi:hypothetical protein
VGETSMHIVRIIWGTLLIAIGTTVLLDTLGIVKNVPIFGISVALVLILIGLKNIIGEKTENTTTTH